MKRFIPTSVGNTAGYWLGGVAAAVHPHVRGEHRLPLHQPEIKDGSSPRPWGTQWVALAAYIGGRFIPTSVGNTAVGAQFYGIKAVHPHVRGEHAINDTEAMIKGGSSPRPWGTLIGQRVNDAGQRFIPTSVGNTIGQQVDTLTAHGSSPRPWGTLVIAFVKAHIRRFIPTSVGNTVDLPDVVGVQAVHPHVRGEHAPFILEMRNVPGSSPRPWGTHQS